MDNKFKRSERNAYSNEEKLALFVSIVLLALSLEHRCWFQTPTPPFITVWIIFQPFVYSNPNSPLPLSPPPPPLHKAL